MFQGLGPNSKPPLLRRFQKETASKALLKSLLEKIGFAVCPGGQPAQAISDQRCGGRFQRWGRYKESTWRTFLAALSCVQSCSSLITASARGVSNRWVPGHLRLYWSKPTPLNFIWDHWVANAGHKTLVSCFYGEGLYLTNKLPLSALASGFKILLHVEHLQ